MKEIFSEKLRLRMLYTPLMLIILGVMVGEIFRYITGDVPQVLINIVGLIIGILFVEFIFLMIVDLIAKYINKVKIDPNMKCPNCVGELYFDAPDYILTSNPPQTSVRCKICSYKGTKTI